MKRRSDLARSVEAKVLTLGTPAIYRISVQGSLNPSWADNLGGMEIKQDTRKVSVTTLKGPLMDQSQLLGVLNNLHQLHMPILSVELISKKASSGAE